MEGKNRFSPSHSPFGEPPAEPHPAESLRERLHGWFLGLQIEKEPLLRALLTAVLIVFFALLQTTLFTRFRPFGVVPDLMLPLVIGIGMTAGERWGAVGGLAAAFTIESLGGAPLTILPLLYMPAGYVCGILTNQYFRDSIPVRALFTAACAILRALWTLFILFATAGNVSLPDALTHAALPEAAATLLFSFLPHAATYLYRLIK